MKPTLDQMERERDALVQTVLGSALTDRERKAFGRRIETLTSKIESEERTKCVNHARSMDIGA